jgi:hypothetical protein
MSAAVTTISLWKKHVLALEDVAQRLQRISDAFDAADVPFALAGGQAAAFWVATKKPAAVRTTKGVDFLVRRDDRSRIEKAGETAGFEYFEAVYVGMLLEKDDPNPRRAVHLIWAGEKVNSNCELPSPDVTESERLEPGISVVSLGGLVQMKLIANRDQDRVHLRDMIGVDLISRDMLTNLPPELAARLDALLTESGR